jgi:hypothetical protein
MATITERQPGVYFARVFLPPTAAGEKGRQVGKVFRGGKKAVRADVAEWEASLRGTAPGTVGATVADLLELWQQAKAFDWQPTTVAAHGSAPWSGGDSRVILGVGQSPVLSSAVTVGASSRSG